MEQSKKHKTLAILGSPHKNGVTAKMLNIAIKASKARGDEVELIYLYDKEIGYCKGCRRCLETKQCLIKDDIVEVSEAIRSSNTIILAAPVYWANVPAPVKNMFDRLLGVAMEETDKFPKPRLTGRNYILLSACKTPMPFAKLCGQSTGAIRAMKEFFKTSGMTCKGVVVCANTSKNKEVSMKKKHKIEACFH